MRTLVLILLFYSCSGEQGSQKLNKNVTDSIVQTKSNLIVKDTIIIYDIDGISPEGCEAKAHYIRGKINDISIVCYYETGRFESTLVFLSNDEINVEEKTYKYKSILTDVKIDSDISIKDSFIYIINSNGELLSDVKNKDIFNIYKDIKNKIPRKLVLK